MINITEYPEIINTINAILNNKGIAEIKQEKAGISVVEIRRTLKTAKKDEFVKR